MATISVKIDDQLDRKLEAIARRRGTTKSAVLRESLERAVEAQGEEGIGSCLELASDLAGAVKAAPDLSTDRRHMAGYGR